MMVFHTVFFTLGSSIFDTAALPCFYFHSVFLLILAKGVTLVSCFLIGTGLEIQKTCLEAPQNINPTTSKNGEPPRPPNLNTMATAPTPMRSNKSNWATKILPIVQKASQIFSPKDFLKKTSPSYSFALVCTKWMTTPRDEFDCDFAQLAAARCASSSLDESDCDVLLDLVVSMLICG